MAEEDTPLPKIGSIADIARRMDRIESRHETLEGEVRTLSQTVGRLEQNQLHGQELAKLRFDAIDQGQKQMTDFMKRIEAMISGEVETAQQRQGREMVADYQEWRKSVEDRLPDDNEVIEYRDWRKDVDNDRQKANEFITQGKFLGRLLLIVLSGNVLALLAGLYALMQMPR